MLVRISKYINDKVKKLMGEQKIKSFNDALDELLGFKRMSPQDYSTNDYHGLKFHNVWTPHTSMLSIKDFPNGTLPNKDLFPDRDLIFSSFEYKDLDEIWFPVLVNNCVKAIYKASRLYDCGVQPVYAVRDVNRGLLIFYSAYLKSRKIKSIEELEKYLRRGPIITSKKKKP